MPIVGMMLLLWTVPRHGPSLRRARPNKNKVQHESCPTVHGKTDSTCATNMHKCTHARIPEIQTCSYAIALGSIVPVSDDDKPLAERSPHAESSWRKHAPCKTSCSKVHPANTAGRPDSIAALEARPMRIPHLISSAAYSRIVHVSMCSCVRVSKGSCHPLSRTKLRCNRPAPVPSRASMRRPLCPAGLLPLAPHCPRSPRLAASPGKAEEQRELLAGAAAPSAGAVGTYGSRLPKQRPLAEACRESAAPWPWTAVGDRVQRQPRTAAASSAARRGSSS